MQFEIFDLDLINFRSAWDFQREIFLRVKNGEISSALILCRHYPVITLGRSAHKDNILITDRELKNKGIEIYNIERGGDVTYHGPGQLTVYPIFDLHYFKRDIHRFLRHLEDIVINLLSDFGVKAIQYPGLTGVWVGSQKIASLGIAIKNWISFHGLSINIKADDLENFRMLKPCGMDIQMTSLESILCRDIKMENIKDNLIQKFRNRFTVDSVQFTAQCCAL